MHAAAPYCIYHVADTYRTCFWLADSAVLKDDVCAGRNHRFSQFWYLLNWLKNKWIKPITSIQPSKYVLEVNLHIRCQSIRGLAVSVCMDILGKPFARSITYLFLWHLLHSFGCRQEIRDSNNTHCQHILNKFTQILFTIMQSTDLFDLFDLKPIYKITINCIYL